MVPFGSIKVVGYIVGNLKTVPPVTDQINKYKQYKHFINIVYIQHNAVIED